MRLYIQAVAKHAAQLRFDEGPVFPQSHAYLEARGVEIIQDVLREEALEVFQLYRQQGGTIYNA